MTANNQHGRRTMAQAASTIAIIAMACSDQGSVTDNWSLATTQLSDSSDLRSEYNAENLQEYMQELVDLGPRVAGGATELAAATIIENRFKAFGLTTTVEEAPVAVAWKDNCGSMITLKSPGFSPIKALPVTFSPPARITARVRSAGLGFPEEFPPGEKGYLALVKRGVIPFAFKAQFAFEAGAAGVIVYNSADGPLPALNAGTPKLPIAVITLQEGEQLKALAEAEPLTVTLKVNTQRETAMLRNVVATLDGSEPEARTVYVMAHYDSAAMPIKDNLDNSHYVCPRTYDSRAKHGSPGANDNASGVAAVLEAARVLSLGATPQSTVKFIAFSGEEVGLSGSLAYALAHRDALLPPSDEEPSPALGAINLDMIGVGSNLLIGNWSSAPDLVCLGIAKADAMGIVAYPTGLPQNSDFAPFEWSGVPAMAMTRMIGEEPDPVFFTDDPNYHRSTDTMDKVSKGLVETAGELATGVAEDAANGLTASCE